MASDVYNLVSKCSARVQNNNGCILKRDLMILLTGRKLEFIAIDILWHLPRMNRGNQYVINITDRYMNIT